MATSSCAFPPIRKRPHSRLNYVTLFTSSKAYAWVNSLQVWGTGTVDLEAQVVHIKGYSA